MSKNQESRFSKREQKKEQKPKPAKLCSQSHAKTRGDASRLISTTASGPAVINGHRYNTHGQRPLCVDMECGLPDARLPDVTGCPRQPSQCLHPRRGAAQSQMTATAHEQLRKPGQTTTAATRRAATCLAQPMRTAAPRAQLQGPQTLWNPRH